MSISEARRQIDLALRAANSRGWNYLDEDEQHDRVLSQQSVTLAHVGSAIVEALAASLSYDGDLNTIRVPLTTLREISVEMTRVEQEEIGLEDLLTTIRARLRKARIDDDK